MRDSYDYFAHRNLFILRMPTSTHESIIAQIVSEIEKQLQAIALASEKLVDDQPRTQQSVKTSSLPRWGTLESIDLIETLNAAEWDNDDDELIPESAQVADIEHLGSPHLKLVIDNSDEEDSRKDAYIQDGDRYASVESSAIARYDHHNPDAAFGDRKDKYPGVVLEVAYSQKKKDLRELAERYILGSDGNIRVVIGLVLDDQQEKTSISIWRPEIIVDHGSEHLKCVQKVVEKVS